MKVDEMIKSAVGLLKRRRAEEISPVVDERFNVSDEDVRTFLRDPLAFEAHVQGISRRALAVLTKVYPDKWSDWPERPIVAVVEDIDGDGLMLLALGCGHDTIENQVARNQKYSRCGECYLSTLQVGKRRPPHWVHPEDAGLILDEDRDWFSGLSDADIVTLDLESNAVRVGAFRGLIREGLSAEDAARRCWKYFPYYYLDPPQRGQRPPHFSGANAELPFLIKDRVSRLAIAGIITKDTAESHETMNAAIRQLLPLLNPGCADLAKINFAATAAALAARHVGMVRPTETKPRPNRPNAVSCWRCKTSLEVTDETRGTKVRCPSCGTKQAMPR